MQFLGFHGQVVLHLIWVGPKRHRGLELGTGRFPVNVLLQDEVVLNLVVEARVMHPDEHAVDAQKVA